MPVELSYFILELLVVVIVALCGLRYSLFWRQEGHEDQREGQDPGDQEDFPVLSKYFCTSKQVLFVPVSKYFCTSTQVLLYRQAGPSVSRFLVNEPATEEGGDEAADRGCAPDNRLQMRGKLLRLALRALDYERLRYHVCDGNGGGRDEHAGEALPHTRHQRAHEEPRCRPDQACYENVGPAPVAQNGKGVADEAVDWLACPGEVRERHYLR